MGWKDEEGFYMRKQSYEEEETENFNPEDKKGERETRPRWERSGQKKSAGPGGPAVRLETIEDARTSSHRVLESDSDSGAELQSICDVPGPDVTAVEEQAEPGRQPPFDACADMALPADNVNPE